MLIRPDAITSVKISSNISVLKRKKKNYDNDHYSAATTTTMAMSTAGRSWHKLKRANPAVIDDEEIF